MSVLAGILAILGLLLSLVAIIGVVAPSIFKNKQTGAVPKRLQLFLGGSVASFVTLAIAGSLMPQDAPPQTVAIESLASVSLIQPAAEPAQTAVAQGAEQSEHETAPAKEATLETLALATQQMAALDQAMKDGVAILQAANIQALGAHSRVFSQLVEHGYASFGSTIFEHLGRCGVAGNHARSWWQAQVSAASKGGVESVPGAIQSALNEYQTSRAACLEAADPVAAKAAEQLSPELQEKLGGGRECLTIFDIDPETKSVVAQPKPVHCSD